MMITSNRSRAFSLIELMVVIAIIALLVSIILPGLAGARRAARQAVCLANLQQIGRAYHFYAADKRDCIAAFTGPSSVAYGSGYSLDISYPLCLLEADQLMASNVSRTDPAAFPGFASIDNPWGGLNNAPSVLEQHSHLALLGYMGNDLLMPGVICPEDRPRMAWQRDPGGMDTSPYQPAIDRNAKNKAWLPYSSSYQLMPAGYTWDVVRNIPSLHVTVPDGGTHYMYVQGAQHNTYSSGKGETLGGRHMSDVAFTAQKVAVADTQSRHVGKKDVYFAYADSGAQQPLLFWDSSVSVHKTQDANPGWDRSKPKTPSGPGEGLIRFKYDPDLAFESAPPGKVVTLKAGYYKWTRGGLKGVDYGGKDIDTSKW